MALARCILGKFLGVVCHCMALARCILGKFLGVVCHCFLLPVDVPTFVARCLHVPINASAPSSERWNCGRE
jgi:hypothetical protein